MAEEKGTKESPGKGGRDNGGFPVNTVRNRFASAIWIAAVLCALFLAIGALCIALDTNTDNGLVAFILDGADVVDLGIFSRTDGIKEFAGENAETKNALVNWGLGAVFWLVVGRIAERIVRP